MPFWKLDGVAVIEDPDGTAPEVDPEDELDNGLPDDELEDENFDPADHTIDEVKEYVEVYPDSAQAMLDAESDGKDRVTLVSWLTDFIASYNED